MKRRAWMLVMSLLAVTLAVMHTSVGLAAHLLTESPVIPERSNPNNETLHIIDAPVSVLPAVDDEGLPDKTLQTVIAPDERIRIADTTAFPYNAMAYLEIDGGKASCSGAFVGLRVLLTAAHCLYDSDGSGFLDSIRVVPGKNGSSEPFGSQFGSVVRIPLQWRRSVDTGRANQQWDWGLVLLPNEDLGKRVGKLTVGVLQTATLKGADFNPVTSGYPGDKSRGTLWATSKPKLIDALPDYLVHDMDVYPGQSGSPIWRGGDGLLVGIVTFGLTIPGLDYNFATRVDRQLLDDILEGCKDMGCSINYAVEPSAPATPAPTPPASPGGTPGGAAIPGRVPGFIILARGEGATRESDFKFSVGKRNSGALEGWLVWAPKAGGHIQNVTLSSVDGGGGTASVWGKVPFQGAQWTFNLVANAQTATMKLHRPDGSVYATWGGQVTGGSVLVAGP